MPSKKRVAVWRPPEDFVVFEQPWRFSKLPMEGKSGDCDTETKTIRVSEDTPDSALGEVWFHELGHAVWDYTALREIFSSAQEEKVISGLMPALFATLKRNGIAFQDIQNSVARKKSRQKRNAQK